MRFGNKETHADREARVVAGPQRNRAEIGQFPACASGADALLSAVRSTPHVERQTWYPGKTSLNRFHNVGDGARKHTLNITGSGLHIWLSQDTHILYVEPCEEREHFYL